MKKIVLSFTLAFLFIGCGSSDTNNNTTDNIEMWNYIVPSTSQTLSFDIIKTVDGVVDSTEIGSLTHEYNVISNSEVNGSWRVFQDLYSITNDNNQIKFSPPQTPQYDSVSGGFYTNSSIGSYLYMDGTGGPGFAHTFAGESYSYSSSSGQCTINAHYDTKTLYSGYTYNDILEVKCEHTINTSYSDDYGTTSVIDMQTPQISYEYYQNGKGWVAQVDRDCIVQIAGSHEFIDDANSSCLKTRTTYTLYK